MQVWKKSQIGAALSASLAVHAQILVDCSGTNPAAYPSISAALPNAGPGSTILVTGACNENVFIQAATSLNLGAWYGQTVTINGNITVDHSPFVYLYGLNVTNPNGNGFDVNSSSVILDTCTSSGNAGNGLNAAFQGDVVVVASGAFDGNGGFGISASGNSWVGLAPFAGLADISNNTGPGIYIDASIVGSASNTNVIDNGFGGSFAGGAGVAMLDGSTMGLSSYEGPNIVQGNAGGGISLGEASRLSVFGPTGGPLNLIQNNGPFGIQAGFGSQVTLSNATVVSDHSGPGLDVYANSQVYVNGSVQILRNGTNSDPRSAGIRVDGNSEAYLRSAEVSQNNGPAILALVNSSIDFTGMTFSNDLGIINCDSSSAMVSDLSPPASTPPSVRCKTLHLLGNHRGGASALKSLDLSEYKTLHAKYKKLATKH